MNVWQRFLLIGGGLIVMIGTLLIVFLQGINLNSFFTLLFFYVCMSVAGYFFFRALESNTPQEPSKPSMPSGPSNQDTTIAKEIPKPINSSPSPANGSKEDKPPPAPSKQAQYLIKKPNKANELLYKTSSVFPFQLFPDVIMIEEEMINIVRRQFFKLSYNETIQIGDIGSVHIYTGPVFASIGIDAKFLDHEVMVKNLWKKDAFKIQQIIDGLMLVENKVMEVPKELPVEQKRSLIEQAGSSPTLAVEMNR